MNDDERSRIARRIGEIDLELNRLSAENRAPGNEEPPATMQRAISGLARTGTGEITPAMLARLRTHFQIIATELLKRQEQCERLANEAAEAADLIARLESDR
jgi:hypothetical protein